MAQITIIQSIGDGLTQKINFQNDNFFCLFQKYRTLLSFFQIWEDVFVEILVGPRVGDAVWESPIELSGLH